MAVFKLFRVVCIRTFPILNQLWSQDFWVILHVYQRTAAGRSQRQSLKQYRANNLPWVATLFWIAIGTSYCRRQLKIAINCVLMDNGITQRTHKCPTIVTYFAVNKGAALVGCFDRIKINTNASLLLD